MPFFGESMMASAMEHHSMYHGAVPGSGRFDFPEIPTKRKLARHSPLYRNNGSASSKNSSLRTAESIAEEKEKCHYCQLSKFSRIERFPITITNTVDDDMIASDFTFIEHSILRKGVKRADEDFRTGCDCKNDVHCQTNRCTCLDDMRIIDKNPTKHTRVYAYNSKGPNINCLRDAIIETRDAIYECHEKCACSVHCGNRIVERGRTIPLDIFKTENRGWGVRSSVALKAGQYVDKYVGEIITPREAKKRRNNSEVAQRKDVYLFALDKFNDEDAMDERLRGDPLEVDGEFMAGPTRFINHSCDPNLRIFARVGVYADKHIHDLAFFATEDIPAQTELTFDYIDGLDEKELSREINDNGVRGDMVKCLCGSHNCRGFLW